MTTLGIICDVGGTLLLTDDLHRAAWRRALRMHGLGSDVNIRRADQGLSKGLDSFAIAESIENDIEKARRVAFTKQEFAQVPTRSMPNPATMGWLHGQRDVLIAGISHSDETWTRSMLQLAGILDRLAFIRGRHGARRIAKATLLSDAASILQRWWGADRLVYCGDTELDREVARELDFPYMDVGSL